MNRIPLSCGEAWVDYFIGEKIKSSSSEMQKTFNAGWNAREKAIKEQQRLRTVEQGKKLGIKYFTTLDLNV